MSPIAARETEAPERKRSTKVTQSDRAGTGPQSLDSNQPTFCPPSAPQLLQPSLGHRGQQKI